MSFCITGSQIPHQSRTNCSCGAYEITDKMRLLRDHVSGCEVCAILGECSDYDSDLVNGALVKSLEQYASSRGVAVGREVVALILILLANSLDELSPVKIAAEDLIAQINICPDCTSSALCPACKELNQKFKTSLQRAFQDDSNMAVLFNNQIDCQDKYVTDAVCLGAPLVEVSVREAKVHGLGSVVSAMVL